MRWFRHTDYLCCVWRWLKVSRWTAGLFLVLKCQPWDKEEESATIITFENKETSTQSMVIIKESRNVWSFKRLQILPKSFFWITVKISIQLIFVISLLKMQYILNIEVSHYLHLIRIHNNRAFLYSLSGLSQIWWKFIRCNFFKSTLVCRIFQQIEKTLRIIKKVQQMKILWLLL